MKIKNILIISQVFYPRQSPRAFRTFELAKELARTGNKVTVLTLTGNYDYTEFENEFNIAVENIGKTYWIKTFSDHQKKLTLFDKILFKTIKNTIQFPEIELMYKIPKVLKNKKGYDAIISIAIPHSIHWGVAKAIHKNKKLCKTWIADCGDPFMGNAFSKPPFYFKYIEKSAFRKANFISIPVQTSVNAYDKEFHDKIKIIPQGFKFNIPNKNKYIKNKIPTFAYAGSLYKDKRDPSNFLKYLITTDKVFKFVMYTNDTEFLKPLLNKLKGKVEIRDYLIREELIKELGTMDFLINFENINNVQSPSKLIDYAISGRPILSIGKAFSKTTVNNFLNANYNKKLTISIDDYRIEKIANQFLKLCDSSPQQ